MLQRTVYRLEGEVERAVKGTETVERPQGVNGTDVEADFIHARVFDELNQQRHDAPLLFFNQQALGVETPQLIVVSQRLYERRQVGLAQVTRFVRRSVFPDTR